MIAPTRRTLRLAAAGLVPALLPALAGPRWWGLWAVSAALLAAAVAWDALAAVPARAVTLALDAPETVPLGAPAAARVTLSAPRPLRVEVLLDLHPDLAPQPPRGVAVAPGRPGVAEVPLAPRRRGRPTLDAAWLRWEGPLGLVRRTARVPLDRAVAVVPDLRPLGTDAFRVAGPRSLTAGVQVERYVGDGSEFEALREYVPGLDPRAISWKASARHRALLCQDFRAERNHQVILALDTGHLMAEPLAGAPRLDHAVSSALLLGRVCLRLGDRVGLYGFDRTARAWTAPQGGPGAFSRLLAASAQLAASTEETNFTLGLTELSARLRRRALVVVFTDFVDTVTAELMLENLSRLARRQLVVFVALRDPAPEALAARAPGRLSDVYRAVAAAELVRERERVLARLRRMGVACVDAVPGAVTGRLVSRYLEVKRRELIA